MADVVDGLTWTRSKADMRMYREMFGMSTVEMGRLAVVDGRTVRAWENPREWVPDRTSWMAAEALWRDSDRLARELAGEDPAVLPYWTCASAPGAIAARIAAGRLSAAGRAWDVSWSRDGVPDGGKSRFRLMTDMLRVHGDRAAALFGVSRQTVVAWRRPASPGSVPTPEAWGALDGLWDGMVARAAELADMMADAAERAAEAGRRRVPPSLTFYRLRSDWTAWHDEGDWLAEDCSVWLAEVLLHDRGLEPSTVYADPNPKAMF